MPQHDLNRELSRGRCRSHTSTGLCSAFHSLTTRAFFSKHPSFSGNSCNSMHPGEHVCSGLQMTPAPATAQPRARSDDRRAGLTAS